MYPHFICRWTILKHNLKGSSKGPMRLITFGHFDNVSWPQYFFLPCPLLLFLIVVVQSLSHVRFLETHGLQHTGPLCPLLSPRVCSNSCPWSRLCYLTLSFSATPFTICLQSFPVSGSFLMNQLVTSGGQSTGASSFASVLPVNIQDWFPLGLTGLISWQSKDSQESSPAPQFKSINSLVLSLLHSPHQFSSVTQSCLTLCDPTNRSMPGLPLYHQLPDSTQTHVHWVGDAIQPSHPLSSPSPPALNLSQHQGLFKWVICSHQVAKVLEFQHQHQSFQWTLRTDLL